jgi:hypothetical protein
MVVLPTPPLRLITLMMCTAPFLVMAPLACHSVYTESMKHRYKYLRKFVFLFLRYSVFLLL